MPGLCCWSGSRLLSLECAFAVGFGDDLPFVFVDEVARFVCLDLIHVNAVALQNEHNLPDAGDVFCSIRLEPADAEGMLAAPVA